MNLIDPKKYDAVLFDLDGVLTDTAEIHAACWKKMFDEYLQKQATANGQAFRPFDSLDDYHLYVDGKPRNDGVRAFLDVRGIQLPYGNADDAPDYDTVCGLGNRKNELIQEVIQSVGVEPFEGSVELVRHLRASGIKTAVVSSSRNCLAFLQAARIADLFDTRIDAVVAAAQHLPGKPDPATFLAAAKQLGVRPDRAVVVEDAIAGVQAGRAGGFALVVGVARKGDTAVLKENGADIVVNDLSEMLPMIHRERVSPPPHIYPPDEWNMVEKQFSPEFLEMTETIFATGNGYLGMRGCFEEGKPVVQNGTFVNGFYESWPIKYGEEAYGFAKTGQTMVNATDSKIIKLYVDDEPFYLPHATLLNFDRRLNMKAGTLDRELLWEMPSGKQVHIMSRRLISFEHRHLAAILYRVTVVNARAPVVISSEIETHPDHQESDDDPRRARQFAERVLHPSAHRVNNRRILLCHQTKHSGMALACGIDHNIRTDCHHSYTSQCTQDTGQVVFSIEAKPGRPIELTKYMAYHTTHTAPAQELCDRAERTLDRALDHGFEELLTSQQQYMDVFWRNSDVQVTGTAKTQRSTIELQRALHFNLFHIIQASGRAEGTGVPARGLTGQAYDGQYFWDSEIYVMPFLTYTSPRVARNLLNFRHSMLDKARERARLLNQRGAKFPWRTINGEEASAYYAAGTAQYHINADIIYAVKKYVEVTGDRAFLYNGGAEMLVETARLWNDLGFYSERKGGKFCIHGVTGPDEYNTVVNNNTYTNLMARENLRYAATTIESLQDEQPDRFAVLVHKTGLEISEVEEWKRAADQMYIPFDEATGIHPQDDGFLDRELWDFKNTPPDKYPLLLHYHPLVIYRRQVIKQADIVLAIFLLGHEFSAIAKKRNFDYYDPMTTGDSSLSSSIQSIVAAEIGYLEKAAEYARYAAAMDLADVGGNVKDGCHIASMGGTWMALVYGLAGMRDYGGHLSFRPRLPVQLARLCFPLTIRGQVLEVDIEQESVRYSLREGDGLQIRHENEEIELSPDAPVAKRSLVAATSA